MKTKGRRSHPSLGPLMARPKPRIEYPQEGEHLTAPIYTVRITDSAARALHVAIDQGAWQEARFSVGFWWFDWTGIEPGEHELIACAVYEDGREAVSEPVHCLQP